MGDEMKKMCWHCNKKTKHSELDKCTICHSDYQKFDSREEYLTYLLDSLLTLTKEHLNFPNNLTNKVIEAIAVSVRNNPSNYPVTVSLYRHMQDKGIV